jgi:hypothetical protein
MKAHQTPVRRTPELMMPGRQSLIIAGIPLVIGRGRAGWPQGRTLRIAALAMTSSHGSFDGQRGPVASAGRILAARNSELAFS